MHNKETIEQSCICRLILQNGYLIIITAQFSIFIARDKDHTSEAIHYQIMTFLTANGPRVLRNHIKQPTNTNTENYPQYIN